MKTKFKDIFFKVLHIICYFLSVFFITLLICGGVSSCSNEEQDHNTKPQQNYWDSGSDYVALDGSDICNIYVLELMYNYTVTNGSINGDYHYVAWTSTVSAYNFNLSSNTYFNTNYLVAFVNSKGIKQVGFSKGTTLSSFDCLFFNYRTGATTSDNNIFGCVYKGASDSVLSLKFFNFFRVRNNQNTSLLNSIKSYKDNGYSSSSSGYTESDLENAYSEGYENGYETGYQGGYYDGRDVGYSEGVTDGYSEGYSIGLIEGYDSGFNDGYNHQPNETNHLLLSSSYDFRQWIGQVDETSGCIRYTLSGMSDILTYKGLTFRSNGNEYNAIRMLLVKVQRENGIATAKDTATGQYLGFNGYYLFGTEYENYCMLMYVDYVRLDDNDNVILYNRVYSMPYVSNVDITYKDFADNNNTYHYTSTAYLPNNCVVDLPYRDITIVENSQTTIDTPAFNDTTLYELLSMQLTQTALAVFNDTGVFSLLRGGFDTLGGILSIQILPNITIGLLLMLPLVLLIIMTVIKVLKK